MTKTLEDYQKEEHMQKLCELASMPYISKRWVIEMAFKDGIAFDEIIK